MPTECSAKPMGFARVDGGGDHMDMDGDEPLDEARDLPPTLLFDLLNASPFVGLVLFLLCLLLF